MFLFPSHHLTGAVVVDADGTKHGLGVAGAERSELLQVVVQAFCYVLEVYYSVDVEHCLGLFGLYMLIDIVLEATSELRYVVPTQRQSGGVGVSSEVDEHVAATL